MREIIFRAWDKELKRFLPISETAIMLNGELFKLISFTKTSIEQTPVVVQQYTGLKDKNGKEIYEGDIIKISAASKGLMMKTFRVVFLKGAFGFQIIGSDSYGDYSSFANYADRTIENGYNADLSNYLEVIGNVHETPELSK